MCLGKIIYKPGSIMTKKLINKNGLYTQTHLSATVKTIKKINNNLPKMDGLFGKCMFVLYKINLYITHNKVCC